MTVKGLSLGYGVFFTELFGELDVLSQIFEVLEASLLRLQLPYHRLVVFVKKVEGSEVRSRPNLAKTSRVRQQRLRFVLAAQVLFARGHPELVVVGSVIGQLQF